MLTPYRGKKLVIAVSGGLDSVALLDLLLRLREELGLRLVVAHANHGRRRSTKDAVFVEKLARGYGLDFVTTELSPETGRGAAARIGEARYRWLEQVRKRQQADHIVTAHQADDQVEALFLNLATGSDLAGLTDMQVETGYVMRPLLRIPRRRLSRYVRRRGLAYRSEATNRSVRLARKRVRHQLITSLQRINPQLVETVSQSMRVFDEEYEVLRHLAEQELDRVTERRAKKSWTFSIKRLAGLKKSVRHLVWREAIRRFHGDLHGFRLPHFENLDDLLKKKAVTRIHLPHGLVASRDDLVIRLVYGAASEPPKPVTLPVPGRVTFGDIVVEARGGRAKGDVTVAARVGNELVVRPPKARDRFKPVGLRGTKLVSDFLLEAKVPRDERPWVPVVTTPEGEIVWVAGHRADRRFVPEKGERVVRLSLK